MFKISGLDHIVLRTAHMDSMVEFYSGVLGCELERQLPAEIGLVQLRAGSALIDLVAVDSELGRQGGGRPGDSGNNLDHFCLQVDAVEDDDIRRHLEAHGISVAAFERRYGAQGFGNSVYLRDPDGNTVELRKTL